MKKGEPKTEEQVDELANYKTLCSEVSDLLYICDAEERILYVNPVFDKLSGHKPEEFIGKSFKPLFDDKNGRIALDVYTRTLQGESPIYELCFKDTGIVCEYKNIPRRNGKGDIIGVIGIACDISKRRKFEEKPGALNEPLQTLAEGRLLELWENEQKAHYLSEAVDQSINIIFITGVNGAIEYVNSMFEQTTGYTKAEVIGKTPSILNSGEASKAVYEEMWKTILAGKAWKGSLKNRKKDGRYYWCEELISPVRNEAAQITHFICVQEDVTEKRELRAAAVRFAANASFDGLTGLYNRMRFIELLEEWLPLAKTHNYLGALLMIDIDKFRLINDTYGNKIGDELLQRIAGFLQDAIAELDMKYFIAGDKVIMESLLCRMGGDEFAVFISSRNEKEALETAEEIRRRMELFQFKEWTGHITISIGIVMYPMHGETTSDLFKKADASIFSAKELGRNRSRVYQPGDLVLEKMHSRVKWKGRIQNALREDRFVPWFQPLLDLKNDTICHYEALVRMRNENGEIVPPGAFIDTAEAVGQISDIDRVVITKTLRYKAMLKKQGRHIGFSMNLSGKELGEKELLDFLRDSISELSLEAKYLNFEITETEAIHDLDRAIKFVRDLRALGCKFSLDDFGVGFTSFKYLKEMEVDYIKIDGSFIRKLAESKSDRLFVKAMVDVAHGLGVRTVAEFVENKETVRILRDYGVDYAQGYFIGKPVPEILPEDYKPIEPV